MIKIYWTNFIELTITFAQFVIFMLYLKKGIETFPFLDTIGSFRVRSTKNMKLWKSPSPILVKLAMMEDIYETYNNPNFQFYQSINKNFIDMQKWRFLTFF